ncbi:MAG TPA: hypothetical protein VLM76_13965 [Patescibacteria group bacterium]|nr:hypothetical protein [Patescibacteria group bacterium]
MAKGTGKKRSQKAADTAGTRRNRAGRLEKALAASLRREAKAATRLEVAQLEVAVLRVALAEVIREGTAVPAPNAGPEAVHEVETPPVRKPAGARPRAARAAVASKTAAAPAKPAPPPPRARRPARPGSENGASGR